jgi:amino acid efflux transporter
MSDTLRKSLGVYRGTALMLNIVIGAGLLTLPGLAVKVAGGNALGAWIVCALAALPLLAVFILLGRRHPDAGGITSYAERAFGPLGQKAASLLFLGAVIFGLPSIALTGGHYIATVLGGSAHLYAGAMMISAVLPQLLPGEGAAKAMAWIASTVLAVIVIFIGAGFAGVAMQATPIGAPPEPLSLTLMLAPFMMLFFAFTGWEVGAGIAEEFRNPRREYPIAMALSFAVATALYLAIAWLAHRVDLSGSYEAPFVAIVRPILGSAGALAVALVAALIVFANLAGAVWGVSRLVFALARDGLLPAALAQTRKGQPIVAVATTLACLLLVLAGDHLAGFGIEQMLGLAGQNFLILYGVAAGALIALAHSKFERWLGALVIAITLGLLALQGQMILYPAVLIGIAGVMQAIARGRHVAADAVS